MAGNGSQGMSARKGGGGVDNLTTMTGRTEIHAGKEGVERGDRSFGE